MKPLYKSSGLTLYNGDCLDVMHKLIESRQARFDFILADPPFNIGQAYDGDSDQQPKEAYTKWSDEWFSLAWLSIKSDKLMAVHCPDDVARNFICYEHPNLLHWINWHYRFAQAKKPGHAKSCINAREHLLVFGLEDSDTTFNPPLVPSDRSLKYGDKRTEGTSNPGQRVAFNIWGLPEDGDCWGRVQGNNAERWNKQHGALFDHPNQLPEKYVARVIETFTNPGDRVLIPFAGSVTEMVVGKAMGRQMVGIEKSKLCCRSIVKRLERGPIRIAIK